MRACKPSTDSNPAVPLRHLANTFLGDRAMANALQQLAESRVAVWLDDLSRARIQSGELAALIQRGVVGITTNPTIFAKAIGSGAGYEEQVHDLALRGTAVGESVRLLTAGDVRAACDVLRPTWS